VINGGGQYFGYANTLIQEKKSPHRLWTSCVESYLDVSGSHSMITVRFSNDEGLTWQSPSAEACGTGTAGVLLEGSTEHAERMNVKFALTAGGLPVLVVQERNRIWQKTWNGSAFSAMSLITEDVAAGAHLSAAVNRYDRLFVSVVDGGITKLWTSKDASWTSFIGPSVITETNSGFLSEVSSSYLASNNSDTVYSVNVEHPNKNFKNASSILNITPDKITGGLNGQNSAIEDLYGNIFICDTGNNRIVKTDKNGQMISSWGTYGSGDGQFKAPFDIATDSLGNVYVADTNNSRIQKFTNTGRL
jgi:hypothetical protein